MLKGKTIIELKDVVTGEVEKYQDENMITKALSDFFSHNIEGSLFSLSGNTNDLNGNMIPLCKNAIGGILLFADARVSTDSLKQGESFENQMTTYEALIKSNPEYEFAGVYADQGLSGTSENRPEFQRMLADCRAGKIDLIITKSISRFARNTTIVLDYTRELKQLGIGVYFEENNINTLSAEGELMMTVLASFAQEESRSISENNKWSIGKRFERGEGMINTTRFMGYDKDETGALVINKKEAKIVRRIFEMYLAGEGCHRIAKILNDEGIKTITGSTWHSSTIKGSEICHIEAVNEDGARYNPNLTDEYVNSYENLILLCANCHTFADNKLNENVCSVEMLKRMKCAHEQWVEESLMNKPVVEPPIKWDNYDVSWVCGLYAKYYEKN